METYKQLTDKLGNQLIDAAKQKDIDTALVTAQQLLESGAHPSFSSGKPMYFAVKNYSFEMIRLLIRYGALEHEQSRHNLAAMCEKGRFDKKRQAAFFDLIKLAISKTGFDYIYVDPFINMLLLHSQFEKLSQWLSELNIPMENALKRVRQRVVFELIESDNQAALDLLSRYLDWEGETLDAAVALGNVKITEYILEKGNVSPSKDSVLRAIISGYAHILDVLEFHAFLSLDQDYVKAAAKNLPKSRDSLAFLVQKGASGYDGKTLYQNAKEENNPFLSEFVRSLSITKL